MRRAPSSRSFGSGLGVGDTRPERAWRRARRERARSRSLASGGETVASRFVDCRGLNANAASGHTPRREGRHEDPTAEEADRHGVSRDPRPESAKSRSRDVFEPASPARDPQRALTQISSLPSPPLLRPARERQAHGGEDGRHPGVTARRRVPALRMDLREGTFPPRVRRDPHGDVRGRGARHPSPLFALFAAHRQRASGERAFLASPRPLLQQPSPPLEDFSKKKVVFLAARASDRARTNTHLPSSLDTLPSTPLLRCPRVTRRAT